MRISFIVLLLILLPSVSSYAQSINYTQANDAAYVQGVKNGAEFTEYISKAGQAIKVGDTIKFGEPSADTYEFSYIMNGKYSATKAGLMGKLAMLPGKWKMEYVVVTKIAMHHKEKAKESPLVAYVYVEDLYEATLTNKRTILDYEKAVEAKEVLGK